MIQIDVVTIKARLPKRISPYLEYYLGEQVCFYEKYLVQFMGAFSTICGVNYRIFFFFYQTKKERKKDK